MSLPKEPRQKMINIMYLVLTALLALNVSSEILNAFKTVNNSLITSNTTTNDNTSQVYISLTDKLKEPGAQDKAKIWHPIANDIIGYAQKANSAIEEMKKELMLAADGDKKDPSKGFKDDDLDAATRVFVKKGKGKALLQLLTDFRNNVLKRDSAIGRAFLNSLPINLEQPVSQTGDKKKKKNWEESYFHMVPTIAALTILSKFQNDIKVSENKVVTFCHEQVGKVKIQQDAFAALAVANATYVLPGQEIEITAGVGGFSTQVSPKISINGQGVPLGEDGAAHYKFNASGLGSRTISVNISYTDQNGKEVNVPKTIEYTVGQSNAAVALDKMNVLFIGVDNPITASGSGDASRLKVSATGGGIVLNGGGGGHYTAKVFTETDDCIISVTTPDGKTTPVKFRVRSIPDPTPYIGNVKSGEMSAGAFKSQAGVRAYVENFFYETQFNVTSFRITGDGEGFSEGVEEKVNSGAAWNEARAIVNKCRPGSFITIEDIRAVGPDGRTRKLTPMIFNLR